MLNKTVTLIFVTKIVLVHARYVKEKIEEQKRYQKTVRLCQSLKP